MAALFNFTFATRVQPSWRMACNRMKCRARPTASGPAHSPLAASTAAPSASVRPFGDRDSAKTPHSKHATPPTTPHDGGRTPCSSQPVSTTTTTQLSRASSQKLPLRSLALSPSLPPSPVPPNCLPACLPAFPPSSCGISPLCPKVVSFIKTPSSLARSLARPLPLSPLRSRCQWGGRKRGGRGTDINVAYWDKE